MTPCSTCHHRQPRPRQRTCLVCHAAYQRAFRPRHSDLSPQARHRANCRRIANAYQQRGWLWLHHLSRALAERIDRDLMAQYVTGEMTADEFKRAMGEA